MLSSADAKRFIFVGEFLRAEGRRLILAAEDSREWSVSFGAVKADAPKPALKEESVGVFYG